MNTEAWTNAIGQVANPSQAITKVASALTEAGCLYQKGDQLEPTQIGLYVPEFPKVEYSAMQEKLLALESLFATVYPTLMQDSAVQQWLGITQQEVDIALDSLSKPSALVWGVDVIGRRDQRINDVNTNFPLIAGYQPAIMHAFAQEFPSLDGHMKSFYDGLIPVFQQVAGKDKPHVYVLLQDSDPFAIPLKQFATQFGFGAGTIAEYDPKNVDVVFRQKSGSEVLADERHKTLLASGVPIISPVGAYLLGHKGWPTVLMHKGFVDRSYFPQSWLVRNGAVLPSEGDVHEFGAWMPMLTGPERKNYVIKQAFGRGGLQIFIGADMSNTKWVDKLEEIGHDRTGSWVIEEMVPPEKATIIFGDQPTVSDELKIVEKELSLLLRAYSVGNNEWYGEMFGARGNKVNGAGVAMPIAIGE